MEPVSRDLRYRNSSSDRPGILRTVLYEATRKKCEFLKAAADRTGVAVEIRNARIEEAKPESFDVVTARALAPLDKLLAYAQPFQRRDTLNLFLKGQSVGSELTLAHKSWRMKPWISTPAAPIHPASSSQSGSFAMSTA